MRWVVGDIHGMLRPLRSLVDAVTRRDAAARLLFVGDYVNRGPDSRGVVDLLLALPGAAFVRGNHDDVFDLVLNGENYDPTATPDAAGAFVWFMNHGLASTFTSYDVDDAVLERAARSPTPERMRDVTAAVPAAHRAFFRSLPPVIEQEDVFVAHAMWPVDEPDDLPGIAAALQATRRLRHQVLWGRYHEADLGQRKRWTRTGYFGHTPVQTFGHRVNGGRNVPIRGPRIVLLDTAAALTSNGRLSAVCVESGELVQVDRAGTVLREGP
jgi:serine/threonine protein phosphatase 1